MKFILITLSLLLVVSCASESDQGAQTKTPEKQAATQPVQKASGLVKREACIALSPKSLADIMSWDADLVKSEQMMSLKKRDVTVCSYQFGDDKALVRMAWKSEAAQTNEVLTRNFEKLLAEGEENLKYREISNSSDEQIIWGVGKDRFGQSMFILRQRAGNASEVQIEVTTMRSEEETFLGLMQKILNKITE
ncbi:MAG: hypothetical protein AB8F95_11195 [Bacteroidia bacterium]